ncbi:MAG: sigma-70 family RNA polymerase sigma factor [Armatimonadota bacterium]|nr:sigma-70 family RNA polymerase sigma factor [Armatimonadota bacterium]
MFHGEPVAHRREEFEACLRPILGPAYGTALHLARHHEDAEDLVQEAAVQAFCHFDRFQSGTNFKAWFFKILVNLFLNTYRKQQRAPETVPLEDASDLYLYTQTRQLGLHARSPDPATLVLAKLDAEQITAALASLPKEYRLVCALYFREEFSYEEIAAIANCPIGTVRSRLHRGRKLLQKALWQMAEEHGIVDALRDQGAG